MEEEGEDNEEGGDKDERIVEGEDEKVEEKADANADADADADADTGAEINADAKAGTRADAAAPAKVARVKPQLLSLEILDTLVLYRAMLVAALLASGADTSELLLYKNRKQVVQVL